MSRGTARSIITIGRWRRVLVARSTMPSPRMGSELAVLDTTTSKSASFSGSSDNRIAPAENLEASVSARSTVRLATTIFLG